MKLKKLFSFISIRMKLLTVVGLLSVGIVGVCGYLGVYKAYLNWQYSEGLTVANQLSDHILRAASRQAIERGVTNTLLSQYSASQQVNPKLVAGIAKHRVDGDRALNEAFAAAQELIDRDWGSKHFDQQIEILKADHQTTIELRQAVDALISGQGAPVDQQGWIKKMTALINSGAKLRDVAFRHTTLQQFAVYLNRELKEAVWGASEFAGLERALVGSRIASGKPFPDDEYHKAVALRAKTEHFISRIKAFIESVAHFEGADGQSSATIERALAKMNDIFLGRFQRTREQVYAQAETGQYPISAPEWLTRSTEGIESILAVNDALSGYVDGLLHMEHDASLNQIGFNLASILWAMLLAGIGAAVVFNVVRRIDWFVRKIGEAQEDKDLTCHLSDDASDELGRIAKAFNHYGASMASLVHNTMETSIEVADAASTMREVSEKTRMGISIQKLAMEEVTSAVAEMVQKTNEVATNAQQASEGAYAAKETAHHGVAVTQETIAAINALAVDVKGAVDVMQQLEQHSGDIGGIVSVIRDIAEQTNLLSLNAAIEAARAGESGRGFAVVADEVRKLAQRTQVSTAEIRTIIEGLQRSTQDVIGIMHNSNTRAEKAVEQAATTSCALESINEAVNSITEISEQIAKTTQEQVAVSDGIAGNLMANINQFSSLAEESAKQTLSSSIGLIDGINDLNSMMAQYKVANEGHIKLHAAKAAFLAWVVRVGGFLEGHNVFTDEAMLSPRECDFGKWYYSEDADSYRGILEMGAIEGPHNEMHRLVREIVGFKQGGRQDEIEKQVARIDALTRELAALIGAVEEKAGAKRESKYQLANGQSDTNEAVDDILF